MRSPEFYQFVSEQKEKKRDREWVKRQVWRLETQIESKQLQLEQYYSTLPGLAVGASDLCTDILFSVFVSRTAARRVAAERERNRYQREVVKKGIARKLKELKGEKDSFTYRLSELEKRIAQLEELIQKEKGVVMKSA